MCLTRRRAMGLCGSSAITAGAGTRTAVYRGEAAAASVSEHQRSPLQGNAEAATRSRHIRLSAQHPAACSQHHGCRGVGAPAILRVDSRICNERR